MDYLLANLIALSTLTGALPSPTTPDLRDPTHARAIGMGGAYEALGYGADAIRGNPAALSLYKRFILELNGSWDVPLGYGAASVRTADSSTFVAAGVAYDFATYGSDARRWAHLVTVAAAVPALKWLHLGLALVNHNILGASSTNSVTLNAGILFRPVQWLTFGASAHNIISNFNVDIPRYFVASAGAIIVNQVTLAFDAHFDINKSYLRMAYHGGAEWLIAKMVPVRLGYEYNDIVGAQYVSGGIGYFSAGSGVDIAYRHELNGRGGKMVTLTLKYQF